MKPLPQKHLAWICALALVGCGGGGGTAADTPSLTPPLSNECLSSSVARLALPAKAQAGRNLELAVLACKPDTVLTQLSWTQTGGPALPLLSARSQALSLEPTLPGTYQFALRFNDPQGRTHQGQAQVVVDAAAPAAIGLSIRGEPSAWAGGALSLRAWPQGLSGAEQDGATIAWSVIAGPPISLIAEPAPSSSSRWRAVFNAPQVSSDTLLQLRATLSLPDGRSASQDFSLLLQPPPGLNSNPLFSGTNAASRVYPFVADSPYAAALADCVYAPHLSSTSPNNLCTLGRLPLLGQALGGATPSVEQVMQRVLVSNDWMAQVFENFLRTQDPHGDFRRMLGATTAVVIGGRIRPAFYWSATGAIYLDGAFLWTTPEQRDTLSEVSDPRSAYGKALSYSTPWRYVLNNQFATPSYPVLERKPRELAALRYELGRLLYHELTHAADFLPPRTHTQLRDDRRVYESLPSLTASQDLAQRLPFFSNEMVGLGRVLFFGETASALQMAYTPDNIVHFFSNDRVNDDYSYSTPSGQPFSREDAAMLIEEAMLQLRYGVLRDFAITPRLADGASSADSIVTWGQRGRIGSPAIKPRLALVLADLMPWVSASSLDQLAPPSLLKPGLSWGQNLDQAAIAANRPRSLSLEERRIEDEQEQRRQDSQQQGRRLKAAQVGKPGSD